MKNIEAAKVAAAKVAVIGAGIAGLSAAIYAKRSGFDVTLIEQHNIAGGMCTSWKRKGYFFEGGIHWLTGSSPNTELYQLWEETGALGETVKVFTPEIFSAVEYNGQIINLFRDLKKTAEHFLAVSPGDEKQIRRLASDVKAFSYMQVPIFDIRGVKAQNPKRMTFGTILKMLPAFPIMGRLTKMSCKEYAEQFEHRGIQRLLQFVPEGYSAVSLIATLATLNDRDGGYPEGGSLAMTQRMRETFEKLGGKLLLNTKVKKVNIENGKVSGVALENETFAADAVIVTQETIAAVNKLFNTPLNDPWIKDLCESTKPAACVFICAGIKTKIVQTPIPSWELDEPVKYAGRTLTEISFFNYVNYEGYAPQGCTTLTTILPGDTYDFWKKAENEGRYEDEKQNIADKISRIICQKFPQAEGNIEVINIATPLTYERYTGAYHGSWMSISSPGYKMKMYPGLVKNVSGLYFAGHRLMSPGGLPVALTTGRTAAQMVCRQFNAAFV